MWVKLSNSGDFLKLIVLSYIRKNLSGWSNYSGIVISNKMNENEIEYRGSKSNLKNKFVKEQRVDGNWGFIKGNSNSTITNNKPLRCTLVDFERNYRINNPSKQLNIKNFSTLNNNSKLNPWFMTGFIDAEGSFIVSIEKNKELKLGWRVRSIFSICLHLRDLPLLLQIQEFL
jgi:hypothetical protein